MPRKVNIELEYSLKVKEAERKKLEALEEVEIKYKERLSRIEAWKERETSLLTHRQKEKEEKASKPRVRRTKEEIEIEEAKQRLKKQYEESHKRSLEAKAKGIAPITSADRTTANVLAGMGSLFGDVEDDEQIEEQEEEQEDEWELEGMSDTALQQLVTSRHRSGMEIPEKFKHFLKAPEPIPKTSSNTVLRPLDIFSVFPEAPRAIQEAPRAIQEASRDIVEAPRLPQQPPITDLPPPKPKKPVKTISRPILRSISPGIHLYPKPIAVN